MVTAPQQIHGSVKLLKRAQPLNDSFKGLHDFVTQSTRRFFEILGLSQEFLVYDPSEWSSQDCYRSNQSIALAVKVVNDLAERGVALIQEFNSSITRNEEQKQFLLQVVEDHRSAFSQPSKAADIKCSRKQ